jgi:hypothetical protein
MFIRNDTSADKKYYNGKLAQISYLDEDEISVILDGSEEEITKSETWEQKKYSLDDEKISKKKFWEASNSFQSVWLGRLRSIKVKV